MAVLAACLRPCAAAMQTVPVTAAHTYVRKTLAKISHASSDFAVKLKAI